MKKTILIIGFLLMMTTTNLFAQYTFDWMQSSGNYAKTSVMSVIDSADNIIVTGYWHNYQMFTRKLDLFGNLQWEVADSSGIQSKYVKPNWINCDAYNNILVVGNRYSYNSSTGWDYPDAIVAIKYNPSGTLLWKTVIPITITLTSLHRFNTSSLVDNYSNLYIGTSVDIPSGAVLYKLDSNGNLIFTSSSIVNSPQNFSSMRLKDDKIVVATGSTVTNVAPIFIWDTTGVLQWTAAATGQGAADVEIDESSNVYLLSHLMNEVSPSSGADMNITKFNSAGIQLWNYDYDFGGSEFPTRFVYLNNRISIIGYGPSSPGEAYFDWKTLQTDTAGTLLWYTIYDATTFNDEQPYNLLAKLNGEVIVTGKGGPSPDPDYPSSIQMPIVQYSNTGNQLWIDTPNMYGGWGLACMLASDASLYAISSSDMTVYHYYDSLNNDASLSDLTVDEMTIEGFNPSTYYYEFNVNEGGEIPTIDGTTSDENATKVVTQALTLSGDGLIVVTAQDGITEQTYTVHFNLITSIISHGENIISVYPNPATDKLFISGIVGEVQVKIMNLLGETMYSKKLADMQFVDIAFLNNGVYFATLSENGEVFKTVKFLKN